MNLLTLPETALDVKAGGAYSNTNYAIDPPDALTLCKIPKPVAISNALMTKPEAAKCHAAIKSHRDAETHYKVLKRRALFEMDARKGWKHFQNKDGNWCSSIEEYAAQHLRIDDRYVRALIRATKVEQDVLRAAGKDANFAGVELLESHLRKLADVPESHRLEVLRVALNTTKAEKKNLTAKHISEAAESTGALIEKQARIAPPELPTTASVKLAHFVEKNAGVVRFTWRTGDTPYKSVIDIDNILEDMPTERLEAHLRRRSDRTFWNNCSNDEIENNEKPKITAPVSEANLAPLSEASNTFSEAVTAAPVTPSETDGGDLFLLAGALHRILEIKGRWAEVQNLETSHIFPMEATIAQNLVSERQAA